MQLAMGLTTEVPSMPALSPRDAQKYTSKGDNVVELALSKEDRGDAEDIPRRGQTTWRSSDVQEYSSRAQFARIRLAPTLRKSILRRDGHTCRYCGDRAEYVDHVVPWSFGGTDDPSNLVAACYVCNSKAYNHVFDSFEDKKEYLRNYNESIAGRRRRQQWRRSCVCPDCDALFTPNVDGASSLLCGSCYARDCGYPGVTPNPLYGEQEVQR